MCREKKDLLFILLLFILFLCLAGALRAEEPGPWYLISEAELRSIEQYREKSEAEKQSWLLQARELKQGSASLNSQLSAAREQNRKLEQSFNEYEADRLMQMSLKNGEIAGLEQALAGKALETEKWKGKAASRLIIAIALAGSWALFIAFKALRFLRIIPAGIMPK